MWAVELVALDEPALFVARTVGSGGGRAPGVCWVGAVETILVGVDGESQLGVERDAVGVGAGVLPVPPVKLGERRDRLVGVTVLIGQQFRDKFNYLLDFKDFLVADVFTLGHCDQFIEGHLSLLLGFGAVGADSAFSEVVGVSVDHLSAAGAEKCVISHVVV